MPTINLGVDFSDVKDSDVFEPLPNATYDFTVYSVEEKTAASSRPMLKWVLTIIHEGKERKLFYNTVLPWMKDGEWDLSGMGMLVGLTKALGKPWTGTQLSTEDYLGLAGRADVHQKPKQIKQSDGSYADDPSGGAVNDIRKFVY